MQEMDCKETKAFSIEKACQSNNLMRNLRSVIESHQNESAKNFGMSIMYLLNDEYEEMIKCLEFLAQNHPEVALIHRRIAEIYINRNEYEKAVSFLETALKLDSDDVTAKIWLTISYFATGDDKKAIARLKTLKDDVFLLYAANTNWFE